MVMKLTMILSDQKQAIKIDMNKKQVETARQTEGHANHTSKEITCTRVMRLRLSMSF